MPSGAAVARDTTLSAAAAHGRARGRLWLGDGSCVRLRPERANHVWSYDFVKAMTHDGRALRILVVIDEYTRECLAPRVARRLGSLQVIETLADVMLLRGIPEHLQRYLHTGNLVAISQYCC